MMIAKIETDSWHIELREEAGLLNPESGRLELVPCWATIDDFSGSNAVLEPLLIYRKRIESSLYKAMNELQKLQRMRGKEQADQKKKQSQLPNLSREIDILSTKSQLKMP